MMFLFIGSISLVYFLKASINDKNNNVENVWNSLKPEVDSYFKLIDQLNQNEKYISKDSLQIIKKEISEEVCTLNFLEGQYFLNKVSLRIYHDSLVDASCKDTLQLRNRKLNLLSSSYNEEVSKYNNFIRSFPINLYTYKRFKTKEIFDLKYGVENENPKTKYDKDLEWMLEIEKK